MKELTRSVILKLFLYVKNGKFGISFNCFVIQLPILVDRSARSNKNTTLELLVKIHIQKYSITSTVSVFVNKRKK